MFVLFKVNDKFSHSSMWSWLSDKNPLTNIIQWVDFVFGFNDSKFIDLMFISFLSDAIFSNILNISNF